MIQKILKVDLNTSGAVKNSVEILDQIWSVDNIYVRFDNTVYQQQVGIPTGTICAPVITDLFLFHCHG